jgi:hypothetical protein
VDETKLTEMTADIVTAFVSSHRCSPQELPELIQGVGKALWDAAFPTPVAEPEVRAKRSYSRRKGGENVGQQTETNQGGGVIVDEREATEQLVEDVAQDRIDETTGQTDDEQPQGWQKDEQTGEKVVPEPMFEE